MIRRKGAARRRRRAPMQKKLKLSMMPTN